MCTIQPLSTPPNVAAPLSRHFVGTCPPLLATLAALSPILHSAVISPLLQHCQGKYAYFFSITLLHTSQPGTRANIRVRTGPHLGWNNSPARSPALSYLAPSSLKAEESHSSSAYCLALLNQTGGLPQRDITPPLQPNRQGRCATTCGRQPRTTSSIVESSSCSCE
jgi:hypothetical protein